MSTETRAPSLSSSDLLTVEEVALLLRLTPKGIYAMTSGRRIPFVRISNRVRFRRGEIERWLDESHVDVIDVASKAAHSLYGRRRESCVLPSKE